VLVVPVIAVVAVFGAYAWFGLHVWRGRGADGPRVAIDIATCAEAQGPIAARLETMGFDHVVTGQEGGVAATVTLPADERVADSVPPALVATGAVQIVQDDGTVLVDGVASASVRMDLRLVPVTVFLLDDDDARRVASWQGRNPNGQTVVRLDGQEIGRLSNRAQTGTEIEVEPAAPDDRTRMELAAARAVIAAHPLPCPAVLRGVAPAPPPG
jgi:hypothetical protein